MVSDHTELSPEERRAVAAARGGRCDSIAAYEYIYGYQPPLRIRRLKTETVIRKYLDTAHGGLAMMWMAAARENRKLLAELVHRRALTMAIVEEGLERRRALGKHIL